MSASVGEVSLEVLGDLSKFRESVTRQLSSMRLPTVKLPVSADFTRFRDDLKRFRETKLAAVKLPVTADLTKAREELRRLAASKLPTLKLKVELDAAEALARINFLQNLRLNPLTLQVNADISRALLEIHRLRAALPGNHHFNIFANTSQAQQMLHMLMSQMQGVGSSASGAAPQVGGLAAALSSSGVGTAALAAAAILATPAILGLAAAAVAAGAGVGAMALVAVPAIGEISEALQAQKQAQANATQQAVASQAREMAIAGARRGLAAAVRNASYQHEQALEGVRDAEDRLAQTQRSALQAQQAINAAREDARRSLQDMANQVADARLAVRQSTLDLADSQNQYNKTLADPSASDADKARAKLRVDQARQNLKEQRLMLQRLVKDEAAARKAGVDGSDQVTQARERLRQANQQVAQSEQALAKARQNVARVDRQSADAVTSARSALTSATMQGAAANSQLNQAMSALSPSALKLMNDWKGLQSAFDTWRKALEPTVLPLFSQGIEILKGQLPSLTPLVKNAAGAFSDVIGEVAKAANSPAFAQFKNQLATAAGPAIRGFGKVAITLATGIGQIIQPFLPLMPQIMSFFDKLASGLMTGLVTAANAIASVTGPLLDALGPTIQTLFVQVGNIVGQLFKTLLPVFTNLLPVFQQIFSILGPLITDILAAIAPLLLTMSRFIGEIASRLLPMIRPFLQVLGEVLKQIGQQLANTITEMLPSILQLVDAFVTLLPTLLPLVPLLGQLAVAFLPLLPPIINLATQLLLFLVPIWEKMLVVFVAVAVFVLGHLIPMIGTLVKKVAWAVNGIAKGLAWLRDSFSTTWARTKQALQWIGDKATWLWGKTKQVFSWIGSHIKWVWENVIRRAFDRLKSAMGTVGTAFGRGATAIRSAWSKVADYAKKPIQFVVETVYNKGIVGLWKKVMGWLHLPNSLALHEYHVSGFASGGNLNDAMPVKPMKTNKPTAIVGEGNRCIARGTMIETEAGQRPIEDIVPGELVRTRSGWMLVNWSGLTRPNAEVVRVSTAGGDEVVCTPDHRIWTTRGTNDGDRGGAGLGGGAVRGRGILPRHDLEVRQPRPDDDHSDDRPRRPGALPAHRGFGQGARAAEPGLQAEADLLHRRGGAGIREAGDRGVPALAGRAAHCAGAGDPRADRGAGRGCGVPGAVLQARTPLDAGEHVHEPARHQGVPSVQEGPRPGVDAPEACWREARELREGDWVYTLVDGELCASRVTAIVPAGRIDTYDLTVENEHEFVAGGILVHNSYPEYVIPTDPQFRGRASALWAAAGGDMQLLAKGGILGDLWDKVKKGAGKLSDVGKATLDFIANPKSIFDKLAGPILNQAKSLGTSPWGKAAAAIPPKMLGQIWNVAKSAVEAFSAGYGGSANAVVQAAETQLGVPYVWGGTAWNRGLDCSGLTQGAYWHGAKKRIPRVTYDQVKAGRRVASQSDIMPGDLIFPHLGHVMMAVNPGAKGPKGTIEAQRTGTNVMYSRFRGAGAGIRRIMENIPGARGGGGTGTAFATYYWDGNVPTASGRRMDSTTIASPTWPLGTKVSMAVNGRKPVVGTVWDFGPADWVVHRNNNKQMIDLATPLSAKLFGGASNGMVQYKILSKGTGRSYKGRSPQWGSHLSGFEKGGIAPANSWGVVGEAGPELVRFGRSTQVIDHDTSRQLAGGPMIGTLVQQLPQDVSPEEMLHEVEFALRKVKKGGVYATA